MKNKMKIFIEKTNTGKKINFNGTVKALLKKLKINIEEVIVARNGELISEDDVLNNKDSVKILSVVSGG
jgi:sulfur carrier protein